MDDTTITLSSSRPGFRIKQRRSQKTYDALITTGFRLLEEKEWTAITIAELSRKAGYSVGAFYARFRSKDDYFDALIQYQGEIREAALNKLLSSTPPSKLIGKVVENFVTYHWHYRNYWRAALVRGMRDPNFWIPLRQGGHKSVTMFINRISEYRGKALTVAEETQVRFGFQVLFGVINNTIINQPGPIFMGQVEFVDNLTRTLLLVTDYERLIKSQ